MASECVSQLARLAGSRESVRSFIHSRGEDHTSISQKRGSEAGERQRDRETEKEKERKRGKEKRGNARGGKRRGEVRNGRRERNRGGDRQGPWRKRETVDRQRLP